MTILLRLYACFYSMHFIACTCENGTKPCEWEPWQPWSSCTITCGVGYRTRNRNMCCGPVLTDCLDDCYGDKDNMQSEVCHNSCPNGGTLVGDLCQCPPMKYGRCCDKDESTFKSEGGCARHCIWAHWYSWGDCSTSCGCGTKTRKRAHCCSGKISNNRTTLCEDDCNLDGGHTETHPCTQACSSKNGPNGCTLCSWNYWGLWSSCSSHCGGGQRLRTRSPCCCDGQSVEGCLFDCNLSDTDATQKIACNQLCFHGGAFTNNSCACEAGFTGNCCSTEVLVSECKKCSWQAWQAWEETGEDGKMRRRRELCCRVGQSAEDCRSECGVEEYSQVQILLNADILSENQDMVNTTTYSNSDSAHADLYLYLYAGGIALASAIVTSLVWVCCCHLKMKRRKVTEDGGSAPEPDCVYEMSVSDQDMDHHYAAVDPGSISREDTGIYANPAF